MLLCLPTPFLPSFCSRFARRHLRAQGDSRSGSKQRVHEYTHQYCGGGWGLASLNSLSRQQEAQSLARRLRVAASGEAV